MIEQITFSACKDRLPQWSPIKVVKTTIHNMTAVTNSIRRLGSNILNKSNVQ